MGVGSATAPPVRWLCFERREETRACGGQQVLLGQEMLLNEIGGRDWDYQILKGQRATAS
jgi:hypothetical protein